MDYRLSQKLQNGEMPADCYRVARTRDELVAAVEELGAGGSILRDRPPGSGFRFGVGADGRRVFATDAYLDGDESVPNPDFREERFATVAEGVDGFTVNGLPLAVAGLGCRLCMEGVSGLA